MTILLKVTTVRQFTLFMLILVVKARITMELTWNTEKVSYTCCQSKNQLLMWNFTEGENERVMELQWFFSETTLICLDSKTIGFHVETLYAGRVERNGTMGILLRNVSLNDTGKYTLYVKLAEENIRNIQHIFLTVEEQVPYHCKPIIEIRPENVLYCSTTCLERSQLSPEWIINGTRNPLGNRLLLRINAGINEQAFCCLRGLKCHNDDEFKFCIPSPIPSKVFTESVHTSTHNETSTVKAANDESNNTSHVLMIMGVIMMSSSLVVIIVYFVWRRHKSLEAKTKKSNTIEECTEDHQQADIVARTTDRSLHHSNSNQNIQIVNNISMDGDFLKCMVESQRMLMTSLEAVREETGELKRQLSNYQQPKMLNTRPNDKSIEMTKLKYEQQNCSDTDTSETTSDYEDAASELLVHQDWSGSIQSSWL